MNGIVLDEAKYTGLVKVKRYSGYKQNMTIMSFEGNIVIKVEPDDVLVGVRITALETGSPRISCMDIPMDSIEGLLDNINSAKAFCEEFQRRKDELLRFEA